MVTTQICKQDGVEGNAVDAILYQCMRRHFDSGTYSTGIAKFCQLPVQFDRRRRCDAPINLNFADSNSECADVPASLAQALLTLRDQPGDGRLSIGSGNANHLHRRRRRIEVAIRDRSQVSA